MTEVRKDDQSELKLTPFLLAGGAAIAACIGFALRDPEVRRACAGVLNDAELHAVCADALKKVGGELVASWGRHGGTAAVLGMFGRLASTAS